MNVLLHVNLMSCLFALAGEERGHGGCVHLQKEATPDHDALLHCPQYSAVQEEDSPAGAAAGVHAGTGQERVLAHTARHLSDGCGHLFGQCAALVSIVKSRPSLNVKLHFCLCDFEMDTLNKCFTPNVYNEMSSGKLMSDGEISVLGCSLVTIAGDLIM